MPDTPGAVVNVIEIVGSSDSSFSDAVRNAVRFASQTVRNITGVEVLSSNANVGPDGQLTTYKVNCKIAFINERSVGGGAGGAGRGQADLAEMAAQEPPEPPYAESGGPDLEH